MFEVEGVKKQIELVKGKPREYQNHLVTFLTKPGKTYTDSVLLIGDAAGFACPYEAEGVYYAMLSGRIAGNVAAKALSRGDISEKSLQEYEKEWLSSPIGEEFIAGDAIDGFVRRLGFNPDAGVWVVPMLNELLFGLCNVADSHTSNARKFSKKMLKYLPYLVESLKKDLGPLAIAIDKPPEKKPSRVFSFILKNTLPPILRLIAKLSARSKNRYASVINPLIYEHFLTPYIKEKIRREEIK